MKQHKLLLSLFILLLIFAACRREWLATEEDMTNYGWTLFKEGDYDASRKWFTDAIQENENYKDGYNGFGWTEGKRTNDFEDIGEWKDIMDDAIIHFKKGLKKPPNPRVLHNVDHDILAGLTFAYGAKYDVSGNTQIFFEDSTIFYGDSLIAIIKKKIYDKTWYFPHDTTTNYLDVHVTLALAHFLKSEFKKSLEDHVWDIEDKCEEDRINLVFDNDTLTVLGKEKLYNEIKRLQEMLVDGSCK